jgi:hypothetical protein
VISLGIGLCPAVRMDLSLLVLAVFFMLSIQTYVRTIIDREFHVAVGGLGPTEMRMGILSMNVGILLFGYKPIAGLPMQASWIDVVLLLTSIGLVVLLVAQMADHLKRLAAEEPGAPRGQ